MLSAALAGQHGCHVLTGPGRTEGRRPVRTGLRTGLLAGLSPGLLSRGGSRSRGPPYVGGGGGNDRILNVRKGGVWCCSALYEQQWRFVMYFCVFFLYTWLNEHRRFSGRQSGQWCWTAALSSVAFSQSPVKLCQLSRKYRLKYTAAAPLTFPRIGFCKLETSSRRRESNRHSRWLRSKGE